MKAIGKIRQEKCASSKDFARILKIEIFKINLKLIKDSPVGMSSLAFFELASFFLFSCPKS